MKTTSALLPTKSALDLTDEGVLAATLDCLLENVPVEMNGACSRQTLFEVLLQGASRIDSIEHTLQELPRTAQHCLPDLCCLPC